jgi:preprotein translocase subunit SecD
MDHKIKRIIKNWRVIIVLIAIVLSLIAIYPNPFVKGITIRSVVLNSSASIAGIESPKPTSTPMSKERILSINNVVVNDVSEYYDVVSTLGPNRTLQIKTNKKLYSLTTQPLLEIINLNQTEFITVEEINEFNETINKTILVNKTVSNVIGTKDLGLSVYNAPTTNLRKGLDLQGGTRVLLEPEEKLDSEGMDVLIENMKYRLNIYGLSDVLVREASDLSGNQYILVEIAGANEEEVKELMAKQGKFESKISNQTVFRGGQDITHVCRTADCSGISPTQGCGQSGSEWVCRFSFAISLSPEAAQRQADLTDPLEVINENGQGYLSEKLYLYLDNALVDELNIGEDLKGRAVTDIQISGSGAGKTQQEAIFNSLANMKRLQTILITGSLPVKLNIIKTDNISPSLGEEFIKSAILIGLLSILAVFIVIYARYRKFKIAIPLIITSLVEIVLLLGVASVIGWNLDLAAIAGIIIAIGTGIDHQIVITDETMRGESSSDWKKKIKNAFYIITGAFLTTVVAMFPLLSAGAGLLKGFALITMIGAIIGVFIARPAYAAVIETLLKD